MSGSNGLKTVYIKFRDSAGNESSTYTDTITLNTTNPTGSIIIQSDTSYTNTEEINLILSVDDDTTPDEGMQMRISNNSDLSGSSYENFSANKSWTLTADEGVKTVYVRFRDAAANESSIYSSMIILDKTKPTGSVVINNGSEYASSSSVNLQLVGDDNYSSVLEMQISNDSTFTGANWEALDENKTWELESSDGVKTVYYRLKDEAGNISDTFSDNITLDTTDPEGEILINNDSPSTNTRDVVLNLSSTDANEVIEMMISEDSTFNGSSFEAYAESKNFNLSDGFGVKVVYVKFKDIAGNISETYSDEILYGDAITPEPTPTLTPTPTSLPSATPIPTSTPSPTPTLSPTNTPSPSPTLSPTPTPTMSPTVSPSATPVPTSTSIPTPAVPTATSSPTIILTPVATGITVVEDEEPGSGQDEDSGPSITLSPTTITVASNYSIKLKINDQSGNVLAGAKVKLDPTGVEAQADDSGFVVFDDLSFGSYKAIINYKDQEYVQDLVLDSENIKTEVLELKIDLNKEPEKSNESSSNKFFIYLGSAVFVTIMIVIAKKKLESKNSEFSN